MKNYVPKAKFINVDFPEDYGPITQTTKTLSFLHDSITSYINSPLNSRFMIVPLDNLFSKSPYSFNP